MGFVAGGSLWRVWARFRSNFLETATVIWKPRFFRRANSTKAELNESLFGLSWRRQHPHPGDSVSAFDRSQALPAPEISEPNKQPVEALEKWRNRGLSSEFIKHTFVDGVNFEGRLEDSAEMETRVLCEW